MLQAHSIAGNGHDGFHRDMTVGKGFCRRAEGIILKHMQELAENQDAEVLAVADAVMA